jgi:hypothetical protein
MQHSRRYIEWWFVHDALFLLDVAFIPYYNNGQIYEKSMNICYLCAQLLLIHTNITDRLAEIAPHGPHQYAIL